MKDGHQDLSASHSGKKLDALTSLRFIAVAMIVVFHSQGQFGQTGNIAEYFTLNQAVSFFFVLSGFVLVYVYPTLNGIKDIGRFLLARIARLWPAHAATLVLALLLIPLPALRDSFPWILLANLSMVHAWVPLRAYFFSFNSLSWAISTEFFFYLIFPLLIYRWDRTWLIKLLASFALLGIMIYLANVFHLPSIPPVSGVSLPALVYISPLARLCEFVFGMTVAWVWRRENHHILFGRIAGTLVELIVLAATVASIHYSTVLSFIPAVRTIGGEAVSYWISSAGSAPLFGLLIFVMALEKGLVSRVLSWNVAVLLGEISYSVYLVHQLLLHFFPVYPHALSGLQEWTVYTVYWMIVLVVSHLMWKFVEQPCRKLINGLPSRIKGGTEESPLKKPGQSARVQCTGLFTKAWLKARWVVIGEVLFLVLVSMVLAHLVPHPFYLSQHGVTQIVPEEGKVPAVSSPSSLSSSLPEPLSGLTLLSGGNCNVEMINDTMIAKEAVISKKGKITLVGWAADLQSGSVPARVIVQFSTADGKHDFYGTARRLTKRPDVARAFNNPLFENAGYDLTVDIGTMPAGQYAIKIIQIAEKKAIVCDAKKRLSVPQS